MDIGRVATGLGLMASGLFLLFVLRWQASSDARLRSVHERNWWVDRRLRPNLRRGRLSKEEWLDRCVQWHRWTVQWLGTPFFVVFVCLAGWMVVQCARQ